MIWFWLLLLLLCSGVISASETALFGVNRALLHEFGRAHYPAQRMVYRLMRQPRRVLMTVLIANTAINVAIFAVSFVAMRPLREERPFASGVASLGVLVAVIAWGEIIPKTIAISHTRPLAPVAAPLIAVLQAVLSPLRGILSMLVVTPLVRLLAPSSNQSGPVTTDELSLLVEQSARAGVINSKEHEMLQAIVAADEVSVREVMTPRVDIQAVYLDGSREEVIQAVTTSQKQKVPVHGGDLDDIRGLLHTSDLFLFPDVPLARLVKPIHFIPEQANLVQLVRHFREKDIEFAIVVDEFGGTAGLVCMDDVVKWLVGTFQFDRQSSADSMAATERIDADTYRIPGDLSVRVWADRFAVHEIDRRVDTVSGLVVALLGRMPREGDTVRIRNLTLKVERMRKWRIVQILLQREGDAPVGDRGKA